MSNSKLEIKIVDFSNALEAIELQREIFKEDGMINILASLDRDIFIKKTNIVYPNDHIKYYLAYYDNIPVGITGLYWYPEWPSSMWLGWFGVLEEYRCKGIGTSVLEWSMQESLNQGKQFLRLYTDAIEMQTAIKLYKDLGFVGEKYSVEKLTYDCYVFSKSLTNEPVTSWGDKNLGLAEQSDFENLDEDFKNKVFEEYKEEYLQNVE